MVYSTCEENAGAPEQRETSLGRIKGEHECIELVFLQSKMR